MHCFSIAWRGVLAPLFLGFALFLADAAWADDVMPEIVVTAQKRTESAQSVPIAIDAINGQALQENNVGQAVDLDSVSPNLTTKNAVGNTAPVFALRGIGLNDFATNGTQPVGVYLDEVYFVSNAELSFGLLDLDRVEVLKGPQGTLYGRNTTAGAVSFITNKPTRDSSAGLSVTGGEYGLVSAEGFTNGPVSSSVAGRFSYAVERQFDGVFHNELTGSNWGQTKRAGWRGQLLWDGGNDTTVLFNYHGGIDKSDDWYYKYVADASGNALGAQLATLAAQAGPDIFSGQHAFEPQPYIDNIDNGVTVTAEHDYKGFTVKSISAAEVMNYVRTEDYGSVPLPNGWNKYAGHLKQYSEEIRATSTGSGPFKWIVGAFFSYDSLDENDIYNEIDNPIFTGYIFNEKYTQDTRTAALFTNDTFEIARDLNLTLGMRYSEERKHYSGGTLVLQSDPALAFDTCPCTVDTKLNYVEPTGKVGLDYKVGSALLYGSVSRGYKAGGVTGFYVTDPGAKAPYLPEFINAYEVGLKSDWFEKKLRVNLAAFYYDYKDLQAFGVISNEFRIFNVAKSRVDGGEIEINALPAKDLRVDLGIGILNTRVEESDVGGVAVGNRLGNAPNIELDLRPNYTFHLDGGYTLKAILEANFRGGTYYYVQNDPRQFQGGYWLFAPRVALTDPNGKWTVSAWAKNAANKHYYREIFNDGGSVIGFPASPRVIGVTLDYHWD
jgi:iron complex outermembrane recepter protein